jgi:hypothetical protein
MKRKESRTAMDKLVEALRSLEPGSSLDLVVQRWKGFSIVTKVGGQWLLEGFVEYFHFWYDLFRAVDPSLPPQLPPQCFDTESISAFFRLPAGAFAEYRQRRRGVRVRSIGPPRPPGRPETTRWIAEFIHERRDRMTMPQIYAEFRRTHPEENGDDDRLRKVYRRFCGRRGKKRK